ncbi:HAMP domain-containing sensor histidine kinase [Lagierella sp.]|uniref:sensor histidine kinase n=1 Tax=Lagierella sp. TaxID=2849657 RepID=UPI002608922E|nr:HAMP domain-containing sensor histidine kinase [Lagierella sp.]
MTKRENFFKRIINYYIQLFLNIDGYIEEQFLPVAIHIGSQYLILRFFMAITGFYYGAFIYGFILYAAFLCIYKIVQTIKRYGIHAFLLVDLIYGFKLKYFKVYFEALILVGLLAALFLYILQENDDPIGIIFMGVLVYRISISILKNYLGKVLLNRKIEALYNGEYEKIYINDPTFKNSIFLIDNLYSTMKKSIDAEYKSEKLKTELITGVSHDIKTPLTSIINYVDLVKRAKTPEQRSRYLETLSYNATRLKSMIINLIEASKAGSGAIDLDMQIVELNELMLQTYGQFDKDFVDRGLELQYNSFSDNIFIRLDANRLNRVFENVFSNIVKYAQEQTTVNVDIIKGKSELVIRVSNKSSITHDLEASNLLNRFTRVDKPGDIEGSGLGLYIAKASIELLNGDFQVKIEEDNFIVEIIFNTRVKRK